MEEKQGEENLTAADVSAVSADGGSKHQHQPFAIDEKVYVREDENFYVGTVKQARISSSNNNDSETERTTWSFLVHFTGWNSRWDRWVGVDQMYKDTLENRIRCSANHNSNNKRSSSRSSTEPLTRKRTTAAAGSSGGGTRAAAMNARDYIDACELPCTLKTVLVDDHERITAAPLCEDQVRPRRMVHVVPAAVSIAKVLHHFCRRKAKEILKNDATANVSSVQHFETGLAELFDEALPKCLLYPQERPQHDRVVEEQKLKKATEPPKRLCELYGCEFLLRLYVRLPALLLTATTKREPIFPRLLTELLVLMQKNRQALFTVQNYRPVQENEWMDWERHLGAVGGSSSSSQAASTQTAASSRVEMDT
jgi:mortality factor 4-like protein 1